MASYSDLSQGVLHCPRQGVLQWSAPRCLTASSPRCLTATWVKVSYIVLPKVSYNVLAKLSYSDLRQGVLQCPPQSVLQRPRQGVLQRPAPSCLTATCSTLLFSDPCHSVLQWLVPLCLTMKCATFVTVCSALDMIAANSARVPYAHPLSGSHYFENYSWYQHHPANQELGLFVRKYSVFHGCEYSYCVRVTAPASLVNCFRHFEERTTSVCIQPWRMYVIPKRLYPHGVRPNRLVQR
jgi:hypothetical protein